MITIRHERPVDEGAREALLDVAYGPERHTKPSVRMRKGRKPADKLALVAVERGRIIGTVRCWPVNAGLGRKALLLGPLAVHPAAQRRGIGAMLMRRAMDEASLAGHRAILLVGDAPYYGRFGFSAAKTGALRLRGADPVRLLGCEIVSGALDGAAGAIRAAGEREASRVLSAPRLLGKARLIPRAA